MSQKTDLLKLFRSNGNRLTLGQIMGTNLAREHSARIRELRQDGHIIICDDKNKKQPSDNIYTLIEEPDARNAAKIKEYRDIIKNYPCGHPDIAKVETQINCLL